LSSIIIILHIHNSKHNLC